MARTQQNWVGIFDYHRRIMEQRVALLHDPVRAVSAAVACRRVHCGAAGGADGGYLQCTGFVGVSGKVPAGGGG